MNKQPGVYQVVFICTMPVSHKKKINVIKVVPRKRTEL